MVTTKSGRQHAKSTTGNRSIRCGGRDGSLITSAKIAGVDIKMEIDTGAAVSIISKFGHNWLDVISLDWQRIKRVGASVSVDGLLKKYAEVFKDEMGTLKDYKANLSLKDSAVPRFVKPRPVPFANSNGWLVWGSSKVLPGEL